MPSCLPDGANLENTRKRARRLQRGVRSGDPTALALLAEHGAGLDAPHDRFPLTAAQRVVARAYGFAGWPRLVAFLTEAAPRRIDPTLRVPDADDPADTFCRLACLTWTRDDDPGHRERARRMLAEDPSLVDRSAWAAATASDPDALSRHLAAGRAAAGRAAAGSAPSEPAPSGPAAAAPSSASPSGPPASDLAPSSASPSGTAAADAHGGPHGWTPLLHLTYSRLDPAVPADRVLTCARLLLDAGADPNAGFLWAGLVPPFTVLTGVFGEGEQGPARQPRHPHSQALARLLLDAGADPNDGQALYNRMFRPDDDHLVLLLEYGLGRGDGGPWRRLLGTAMPTGPELLRQQAEFAVEYGYAERVRLLATHGADVVSPLADGTTLVGLADAKGDVTVVEALVAAGARRPPVDTVNELVAAVQSGDADAVDALLAAHPGLAERARTGRPGLVVRLRRPAAVALAARLGFDLDARPDGRTALHEAAFADDVALARALVEAGADPTIEDTEHHSTPLGWAQHARAEAAAAYLSGLERR
jgi:hypothetical protein